MVLIMADKFSWYIVGLFVLIVVGAYFASSQNLFAIRQVIPEGELIPSYVNQPFYISPPENNTCTSDSQCVTQTTGGDRCCGLSGPVNSLYKNNCSGMCITTLEVKEYTLSGASPACKTTSSSASDPWYQSAQHCVFVNTESQVVNCWDRSYTSDGSVPNVMEYKFCPAGTEKAGQQYVSKICKNLVITDINDSYCGVLPTCEVSSYCNSDNTSVIRTLQDCSNTTTSCPTGTHCKQTDPIFTIVSPPTATCVANPVPECTDGDTQNYTCSDGTTQIITAKCIDGKWVDWVGDMCPTPCVEGSKDPANAECGLIKVCSAGTWHDSVVECPLVCADGQIKANVDSCGSYETCYNNTWTLTTVQCPPGGGGAPTQPEQQPIVIGGTTLPFTIATGLDTALIMIGGAIAAMVVLGYFRRI